MTKVFVKKNNSLFAVLQYVSWYVNGLRPVSDLWDTRVDKNTLLAVYTDHSYATAATMNLE